MAESLRVGAVEFVSPNEIKALLDIEAPDQVALNGGDVRPFPRVNGYLLMPVEDGYLVGQIEWLTLERAAFPKRSGVQDFGLLDLPYPLRRVSLNPLGMLRQLRGETQAYAFTRGSETMPSIGGAVLLPTEPQLRSIVESGPDRRVRLGISPQAGGAEVRVDPNRLFGRHLAVLGNTGSGKSCSVVGLIRWSLEGALGAKGATPNARFVILDPNGEYARAFSAGPDALRARVVRAGAADPDVTLRVPLWIWNSTEWSAFAQASAKTQRPLLKRALREVRAGRLGVVAEAAEEAKLDLRRYLSSVLTMVNADVRTGNVRTEESKFGWRLQAVRDDLAARAAAGSAADLQEVLKVLEETLDGARNSFQAKDGKTVVYFRAFSENSVKGVLESLEKLLLFLGGVVRQEGPDEDVPLSFRGVELADHLEAIARHEGQGQYVDFLVARIRMLIADPRMSAIVDSGDDISLANWLETYLGGGGQKPITVVDLSLVPSDIVHVVTAVLARTLFEALQRHVKTASAPLPTVLVMEEAHTFIKRYRDDAEDQDAAAVCCRVFERIAREGRKFGLGLVLSSQRPSELSPTVLSQCNSFLLHRITNDRDQELVHRLVPDNLKGLLRELPSMPSRSAILLGSATELPVLVRVDALPFEHQPRSQDPEFWETWIGRGKDGEPVNRPARWTDVADDWQGKS